MPSAATRPWTESQSRLHQSTQSDRLQEFLQLNNWPAVHATTVECDHRFRLIRPCSRITADSAMLRKLCSHPCLSLYLSVCLLIALYSKTIDQLFMKFYGKVEKNPGTNRLHFEPLMTLNQGQLVKVAKGQKLRIVCIVQICRIQLRQKNRIRAYSNF